ncbi:MAG: amidohydrolase [Actinomycetota bacterium]|nr:amidohydrolase [Actinomycetota bacterium]
MGLLLVAERVRTLDPRRPGARVVAVDGDRITWVGDDPGQAPPARRRLDLDGAMLQPAFVDAHVHLTPTGLALGGLDLSGCASLAECLAAVRAAVDAGSRVVWGSGWDELVWPEQRAPSADELVEAARGRPTLLTRVDGHSAVTDRASLQAPPLAGAEGLEHDASGRPTGLLRRAAHHVARRGFLAQVPDSQLSQARTLAARHAVGLGLASVHEMGGPDLMGQDDFDAWLGGRWPLEIVGYWGARDLGFVARRGLRQAGGDLFVDGSLGSATAALDDDYADRPGRGFVYESAADLAAFVTAATRRGVQVGVHCIGDRAVRQSVDALEAAAGAVGVAAVRAARHRLEHCELVPPELIRRIGALGAVASVQPAFDRLWGGPGGLYERRLGPRRAALMNPLRSLADAGVTLAFGSDANVTPLDPWAGVAAAVSHHHPDHRLDEDTALRAAILGGRRAARQDGVGRIAPGQRADLAAFTLDDGAPGRCVLTMVRGVPVHAG